MMALEKVETVTEAQWTLESEGSWNFNTSYGRSLAEITVDPDHKQFSWVAHPPQGFVHGTETSLGMAQLKAEEALGRRDPAGKARRR